MHSKPHFDPTSNRAFLYGESVFTSCRVENGHAFFWQEHLKRLKEGAKFLWPQAFNETLLDQLRPQTWPDGVTRITLAVEQGQLEIYLQHRKLPSTEGVFTLSLLEVGQRPVWWPAFLKSGDYLAKILWQRQTNHIPLGVTPNGEITETAFANVCFFDGKKFIAPSAGPNVLDGIGLRQMTKVLADFGLQYELRSIHRTEMTNFQSGFLINAVRGIIPIRQVDEWTFSLHPMGSELAQKFWERS